MSKIIVLDIETVAVNAQESLDPFISSLRGKKSRAQKEVKNAGLLGNISGLEEDKYSLAIGKAALTPVASQVMCIGIIERDIITGTHSWLKFIGNDEKEILGRFYNYYQSLPPEHVVVTFNGRNFDFPFLLFRSGIRMIPLRLPLKKYNGQDNHIDMCQHLDNIGLISNVDGSLQWISLDKWSRYLGFGPKKMPNLELLYNQQDWTAIEEYCKNDVMVTSAMFDTFQSNFDLERLFRRNFNSGY